MKTSLFHSNEKVLLVGEGNFSFGVCLSKLDQSISLTATCYESPIVFESAKKNAEYLRNHGARVLLGVDATKLGEYFPLVSEEFDKIIFNFPHTGGKMKISRNRKLLREFFISAENLIKRTGSILVSLCNGQGGTPADSPQRRWDDSWQIVEMAAYGNFLLTGVQPFSRDEFPGYTSVGYRSLEKGFGTENLLVHIFQKAEKPDSFNIALISDLNFQDLMEFKGTVNWRQMTARLSEKNMFYRPSISSIYPLRYVFDITFSVGPEFTELNFYLTLYRFAGNLIEIVDFLGAYEFSESAKVTRSYRIGYRSPYFPLYRARVIDIHQNVVTNILEDHLNVTVTK
ncbi:ferredoxin-fold anticodon-binding domain-containing protein 1 isoform X4 [Diprion similis]|uniref:ferredoxin-fold anticodon-binding domain-containing protein 1 isoform X4 n=1 Tax=Diprion similis TaxID=362088 RepID=UPI001EF90AC4|nr:ferredoxin-fold anticodon-binding domain-containing protein 1 isoform X4 [Diprion similis]